MASVLECALQLFEKEELSPNEEWEKKFLLLAAQVEKYRRGTFGKVGNFQKDLEKKLTMIEDRLTQIEKHLNIENPHEKNITDVSDLPLFQLAGGRSV
jgi:hypothetical protein